MHHWDLKLAIAISARRARLLALRRLHYHENLAAFWQEHQQKGGRLIGFSVRGSSNYLSCEYQETDWLLFGRETAGLPPEVINACDERVHIKIAEPNVRSLNLSVSVAIGLFEAIRQENEQG